MADNNFHIIGRTSDMPDVQRTYMWQVDIVTPNELDNEIWENKKDLTLRARTASIPNFDIASIESNFMGMKQMFSGNKTFSNSLSIEFEEFEDQNTFGFLQAWGEYIFSTLESTNGGGADSTAVTKKDYATTITLTMYKQNREKLPKKIVFKNAWIKSVSESNLSYGDSNSVKYNGTFSFDYYTIERA